MNEQMVKLLGEIRDELKATRQEFSAELKLTRKELSSRLDETNSRLERVERRQVESEVRLATEIVAVATANDQLNATLTDNRKLRAQVTDHESRLRALEKKRA
jgi:hypothetical protein